MNDAPAESPMQPARHGSRHADWQTRCPHCHTRFRITPAQIEAAHGQVRCGVCNQIFDCHPSLRGMEKQVELQLEDFLNEGADDQASSDDFDDILAPHPSGDSRAALETGASDDPAAPPDDDLFTTDNAPAEVVPPPLRHANQGAGLIATLLWSLGCLVLIASLLLEYAWFHRNELAQVSEAQPLIEKLCQHIDCQQIRLRDPARIELLSRNVYTHPNHKQALMISLTLVNHAPFAQAYPDIRIDFSDLRGQRIASRRFRPEEYLQTEASQLRPLEPDLPASFTMEIVDPGKQAITYEFSFL